MTAPPRLGQVPSSGRIIGAVSLLVLGCAAMFVLFRFDPAQHGFYPVCFLHQSTGLQCPGCGSLRAAHHLLHGDLAGAWHFNPLLVTALPLVAGFVARFYFRRWQGRDPWNIPAGWLWASLVVALMFGVARNL